MEKLQFTIKINAAPQKVWDVMLADASYREWTAAFHAGSYFKGDWTKGSKILFLGPDDRGSEGGMVSMIEESRPAEFISIRHLGIVQERVEITSGKDVEGWAGAHENYTFKADGAGTELIIDLDSVSEMAADMKQMWPKALEKLKELAEK